jgi:penicillin-binding protein 1C
MTSKKTSALRPQPEQKARLARPETRFLVLIILAIAVVLTVSSCTQSNQLGGRPAESVVESVEIYLQRYQPGPTPRLFQTTQVTDRHGVLLAELWEEGRRTWMPLDRISPHLIDATVATEDATFYVNAGIDTGRIAGAALQNLQEGQILSGASTITMQLARNLFLGAEQRYNQTMDRKLLEAGLAQELTALFSKNELLEMYLNLANYGHLAYGPQAAARIYFNKASSELTLAEATLMAGIPQQPANLDLFQHFDQAKARQRVVLDLMVRHGYLGREQADAAYEEPVALNPDPDQQVRLAPHFVLYVANYLDEKLGEGATVRGGFRITTTLDLDMQDLAQAIVTRHVNALRPTHDLGNSALVAVHPNTGEILAMVGSADFYQEDIDGQVNVAISPRQPGSALKPLLYATAFEDNLISPATVLWDIPVTYTVGTSQIYTPTNYDGTFHGPVTARTALANSYNIPAVKLLHGLTVDRMLEGARVMGLHSLDRDESWYGLSLTLGGGEVTLLDLTTAYATLANEGRYVEPRPVLAIRDRLGHFLEIPGPIYARPVLSPGAAFLVTDILSDNTARAPAFGTNSPLRLSRPAAAKTGTTTDWRDNWTVGYTKYLVVGVWSGNSDGRPMRDSSGLTGAAPIWHDFLEAVLTEPMLLATLHAPEEEQAWLFSPPPDVQRLTESSEAVPIICPPGTTCREGGEYFTQLWLEAAGTVGPLADSVAPASTAPVYADYGDGSSQWTAYCQTESALQRLLLLLPHGLGLPNAQADLETRTTDASISREHLHAIAWSLHHPTPVDLGSCQQLHELVPRVQALGTPANAAPVVQVLVDLSAAQDPNASPIAGTNAVTLLPVGSPILGANRYGLHEPVTHHNSCPGNYVIGQVLGLSGDPVAGVHIVMFDQWGNRADAISKDGTTDFGRYDFPLHHFANQYRLVVVDSAGNPLSSPVIVNHLQEDGQQATCHTVNWRGF